MGISHLLQAECERSAIITENTEVADLAAKARQHRHQHETIRVEQLRSLARRPRRYQFVAGRKHGDADAPDDVEMRQAERGRERDILWPQTQAGCERGMADRNVFARGAHIGAGFQARRENNPVVPIDAHIFLHEYRVGTLRHRRSGKNPHGMTRFHRLSRRRAGLNASGHGKCLFVLQRKIAAAHGITIDGGIGERRQRQGCGNVPRENAPIGLSERNGLNVMHRRHPRGDDPYGFIDRHHRPAERKTIVGQLRHFRLRFRVRFARARLRQRSQTSAS